MQRVRPAFAMDPMAFGRSGLDRVADALPARAPSQMAADVRLFVITFLGGFIFVSAYLA